MKNTNVKKGGRVSDTVYNNDGLENMKIGFNAIANTYKARSVDFINIGTTPSLAEVIIPQIIEKYNMIKPDVKFNLIN